MPMMTTAEDFGGAGEEEQEDVYAGTGRRYGGRDALQQENRSLGTLIVLAAEAMLFAGLLAAFTVLQSGTASASAAPVHSTQSGALSFWLPFGIGAVALCTLELARRHARGGLRLTAHWGANLGIFAAVAWLVVSSGSILGFGGGSPAALAALPPVEGCRVILHTLLALHVLATLLLTGKGVWRLLRTEEGGDEYPAQAELLWGFALVVQTAIALLGG